MARHKENLSTSDIWVTVLLGGFFALIPVLNLYLSLSYYRDVKKHSAEGKWCWDSEFPERRNGLTALGIWVGTFLEAVAVIVGIILMMQK